jgi:hypothetical protein
MVPRPYRRAFVRPLGVRPLRRGWAVGYSGELETQVNSRSTITRSILFSSYQRRQLFQFFEYQLATKGGAGFAGVVAGRAGDGFRRLAPNLKGWKRRKSGRAVR